MPPTNLHGLKTSSSESIASPTAWPSVASRRLCSRRFRSLPGERRQRVRQHSCRESIVQPTQPHASPAAAPSVSTVRRLLAFLGCVRFTESRLSRHSRLRIHRESGRYSRNSFRASVLNPTKSPNHALQRTAPRVTLAATHHPAAFAHPAPAMSPQPARRAPQSLSLRSLGVLCPLFRE